jgi:hypothetical protein
MDPEEVGAILAQAVKLVQDGVTSPNLQPIAFEKAIEMLLGSRAKQDEAAGRARVGAAVAPVAAGSIGGSSALDRLAARLRLSQEVVEAVFTVSGDELALTVPPDKLSKSKGPGAREIALLVAASTQAASDEPTTADEIRKAVADYDKLDSANFASTMADLKGNFLIGGTSRARTFKLTKPGWAAAATLVAKLGGADSAAS